MHKLRYIKVIVELDNPTSYCDARSKGFNSLSQKDFQVCVHQEQSMTVQLFRFMKAMNEHTRKKKQETVQSG